MEKNVCVQFPLWVKCQIEHEEEEQQNLKAERVLIKMLPGSPTVHPSQIWCRKGGNVLSSYELDSPIHFHV